MDKRPLPLLHSTLLVLLVVVVSLNLYFSSSINYGFSDAQETPEPAEVSVVYLDASCEQCLALDDTFTKAVEVEEQDRIQWDSKEGKALVARYKITSLPAIVVTGDIDKMSSAGFKKEEDALVLTPAQPPYVDPSTGGVRGLVDMVFLVDNSCEDCVDLSELTSTFKEAGVALSSEETVDHASAEGIALVEKYGVKTVPTIILEGDIGVYEDLQQALSNIGDMTEEGFVLRTLTPPFRNLTSGKVAGVVSFIALVDPSCESCYDPALHKDILARLGMVLSPESTVDVASAQGQALVEKYSIESVPTIILGSEAKVYSLFQQVWAQVGSKEADGSFVFRRNDALGEQNYKVLATGEITNGANAAQAPSS